MPKIIGFGPIVDTDAKVLVLGSMPGEASLAKQEYYGHAQNAFWKIMGELCAAGPVLSYARRTEILTANGIAVWDVIHRCCRVGSMDAMIEPGSIITNDFASFFGCYGQIAQVFFNGAAAEKIYRRLVLPQLPTQFAHLEYHRLPSTSPAYASLSLAQKIAAWRVVVPD